MQEHVQRVGPAEIAYTLECVPGLRLLRFCGHVVPEEHPGAVSTTVREVLG